MSSGRIAVTGSSGLLGQAVVDELLAHGYAVVAADRLPPRQEDPRLHPVSWDGPDVAGLRGAIDGCMAMVHLAAIPAPYNHPHEEVFGNNTLATFAALQAAADVGIRSCAIASSVSAYGTAFSPEPTHARYVPVDEAHPMENRDPYGLSKEVDEATAAMFCRRYEMTVAALRFHWIADRDQQTRRIGLLATQDRDWPEDLRNLWGYVDLRDASRACRLAVEAAGQRPYGFMPMNIVAADALSPTPLTELLAEHAPDIEVRGALGPSAGAFDIRRARDVIGWEPLHSWRDAE